MKTLAPKAGNRAGRWMTGRYRFALAILALAAVAGFAMTQVVMHRYDDILEVVNVAGRQRMLSQRTALLAEKLGQAQDATERRILAELLADATQTFEATHLRLTGVGGQPSPDHSRPPRRALQHLRVSRA